MSSKYPRHRLGSVDVGRSNEIEIHIGQMKCQLRDLMGQEEFGKFYQENHTFSNLLMAERMEKKLAELQPDTLFRQALEDRQDELLAAYPVSDNQAEIALELAEIGTALERE